MGTVFFGLILVAFTSPAIADDDEPQAQPVQELIQTELVYPQEKGELQLTAGAARMSGSELETPLRLEYGLTDAWQLEFEYLRQWADSTALAGNEIAFGTKYSFMNLRQTASHAAVGLEVEFERGEDLAADRRVTYTPYLAGALDLPALRSQVFAHVGLTLGADEELQIAESHRSSARGFANGGFLVDLRRIAVAGELSLTPSEDAESERDVFVTPSVVFKLPRRCELAAGVPVALNSQDSRPGFAIRFTVEH